MQLSWKASGNDSSSSETPARNRWLLLAQQNAEQLGIKAQLARSPGSDYVKFEHAGIPVVFLFRPDDLYNHTPKDTVDRVDAKLLEISARLATAIVVSVSRAAR